jgi:hypothetical protein
MWTIRSPSATIGLLSAVTLRHARAADVDIAALRADIDALHGTGG